MSSPRDADSDHGSAGERQHPRKRRRVALACQPCRDRKSKCNGAQPVCSLCEHLGSTCLYPSGLSKTDLLRQEFTSALTTLQSRMNGIERLLARLDGDGEPGEHFPNRHAPPGTPRSSGLADILPSAEPEPSPAVNGITIPESAFQSGSLRDDLTSDAIGMVPLTSQLDCAFFGPSSNITFLRLVSRALVKIARPSCQLTDGLSDSQTQDASGRRISVAEVAHAQMQASTALPPASGSLVVATKLTMPPERKVKQLLSAFFANCGHVHAYIHRGRLLEMYDKFRRSNYTVIRRSWLALLYVIFALTAFTWPYRETGKAHVNAESEEYYRMASELCMKQVMTENVMNIEIVQCLMSMAMYLQGTQSATRIWIMHGLAVRIAYQIGLHSSEAPTTADPIEREVRRRTWYSLVLLDRTMSTAFGRPPEIQHMQSTINRPLPFKDLVTQETDEMDCVSCEFLDINIGLSDVTKRAIEVLYDNNCGASRRFTLKTISDVYSVESDIVSWADSLPTRLSVMEPSDFEPAFLATQSLEFVERSTRRLRTVNTLRYLSIRLLIYRPVLEGLLEMVIRNDQNPDLRHLHHVRRASSNLVSVALTHAARAVSIIHCLVARDVEGQRQLGAWWFSLYFTFNASLVILSCYIVSRPLWGDAELLSAQEQETISQALIQALQLIDGLDEGHPTLSQCRMHLERLMCIFDSLRAPAPHATSLTTHAEQSATTTPAIPTPTNAHSSATTPPVSLPLPPYPPAPGPPLQLPPKPHPQPPSYSSFPFMYPQVLPEQALRMNPNAHNGVNLGPGPAEPLRQVFSDADLESFLFPMDLQTAGGYIASVDHQFL